MRLLKRFLFPTNSLKPIKKSKEEYFLLTKKYDYEIEQIVRKISFYKKINRSGVQFIQPTKRLKLNNSVSAVGDWMGPVFMFEMNGQKKVFRGIKKESVNDFLKLWKSGVLQGLSKEGFIPKFWISDYFSDEYPLILEIEYISIKFYWEWDIHDQINMLIFGSTLSSVVRKLGLNISDPHYANMGFCDNKPVYFDIGSFSFPKTKALKLNDYSLVILGFYRVVFSFFKESILFTREPGKINIYGNKNLSDSCFEYTFYKTHFLRYHRLHSSKLVNKILKRIFNSYIVYPQDIEYLFK